MTTAEGMHPMFSGKHTKLFLISDLNRSLPTSHGVCRSALYPFYVKYLPLNQQQWTHVDISKTPDANLAHHVPTLISTLISEETKGLLRIEDALKQRAGSSFKNLFHQNVFLLVEVTNRINTYFSLSCDFIRYSSFRSSQPRRPLQVCAGAGRGNERRGRARVVYLPGAVLLEDQERGAGQKWARVAYLSGTVLV